MDSALAPLLWFAGIVAAIPLVLWLVRRSPVGSAMAAGPMRTISQLPLSAAQRIVTVEVGSGEQRVWLVLGVGPQGIRTLHTMAPQAEPAPAAGASPAGFAQLLGRARGERPGKGAAHGR